MRRGLDGVILRDPGIFARVSDDGQHREHGEVAALVVGGRERADLRACKYKTLYYAFRTTHMKVGVKLLLDVRRNVLGGEEEVQLVVRSERHDYWLRLRGYRRGEMQVKVRVSSSGRVGY